MTDERLNKLFERLTSLIPNADEEKIEYLLEEAQEDFKTICNRDDVPDNASAIISQMVSFRYNHLGTEGLSSQSFSGMSESLMSDYPDNLKRAMYGWRKVKLV